MIEMGRKLLLEHICPTYRIDDCIVYDDCEHCEVELNKWLDEYDKHVIEQYKADTELKETIRDIHDNVAREMYCKGVDDFVKFANTMPTVEEEDGTTRPMWLEEIAEELKEGEHNAKTKSES